MGVNKKTYKIIEIIFVYKHNTLNPQNIGYTFDCIYLMNIKYHEFISKATFFNHILPYI